MSAIGRPVRVTSLSFVDKPLADIARCVAQEGARGTDLIALPETWRGQGEGTAEPLDGPTVTAMAALARRYRTYIVCPIDRTAKGQRLNSAVLLDRDGAVACVYDKIYPYWSEFDVTPPVAPGGDAPVYAADFGRIGMAICFDVNFPSVWATLAERGAELVIWPSAYSAGTTLQAYALLHHFYIVTSTQTRDCLVYDLTGQQLLDEKSAHLNISRITLDLDRGIYHENFNLRQRDRLLAERPDDVYQQLYMEREQWFVLQARRPGVSARALARHYGLEELPDYLARSKASIDQLRRQPSETHAASSHALV